MSRERVFTNTATPQQAFYTALLLNVRQGNEGATKQSLVRFNGENNFGKNELQSTFSRKQINELLEAAVISKNLNILQMLINAGLRIKSTTEPKDYFSDYEYYNLQPTYEKVIEYALETGNFSFLLRLIENRDNLEDTLSNLKPNYLYHRKIDYKNLASSILDKVLLETIKTDNTELLKSILLALDEGVIPQLFQGRNNSPNLLFIAVKNNSYNCLNFLMRLVEAKHIPVTVKNENGESLLELAVTNNYFESVQIICNSLNLHPNDLATNGLRIWQLADGVTREFFKKKYNDLETISPYTDLQLQKIINKLSQEVQGSGSAMPVQTTGGLVGRIANFFGYKIVKTDEVKDINGELNHLSKENNSLKMDLKDTLNNLKRTRKERDELSEQLQELKTNPQEAQRPAAAEDISEGHHQKRLRGEKSKQPAARQQRGG